MSGSPRLTRPYVGPRLEPRAEQRRVVGQLGAVVVEELGDDAGADLVQSVWIAICPLVEDRVPGVRPRLGSASEMRVGQALAPTRMVIGQPEEQISAPRLPESPLLVGEPVPQRH